MLDLHAHLLPGLDHGARDWDEALAMCRIAVADGITTIAATPHVSDDFPNGAGAVREATAELRRRCGAAGIALEILVGGDYHVRPDLAPANVITLGDNGRFFLLEFPYQALPPRAEAFVALLATRGLVPIVTHPERTLPLQSDWRRLEPLVRRGALVQLTAGSLLGDFGEPARAAAERFLRKGLAHLLASDAHWADERPPRLAAAVRAASRIVGEERALALVGANPAAVIAGRDPRGARPSPSRGETH